MTGSARAARPVGVSLLIVLFIASVPFVLVMALAILVRDPTLLGWLAPWADPISARLGLAAVVAVLVFYGVTAVAGLVVAVGMIQGRRWSWTGAMILTAASLLPSIGISAIDGTGWDGAALSVILVVGILYYLTRPRVRAFLDALPAKSASAASPL